MRIRFFSYFYPPCIGGGEVILQHQAEELARRGHQVAVHTTPFTNLDGSSRVDTGYALENGVRVYRQPSAWLPFRTPLEKNAVTPAFAWDVWRPADLLVGVGFPSLHLDLLSARARRTRTPLIVQNYITADFLREILAGEGGWNKRVRAEYWRRHVRARLAQADRVIADSPAAGRALQEQLGLSNVVVHIGMAVDPDAFDRITDADRQRVRAELGLGADRIVLAPSRIARQKGTDLLLEAMAPLLGPGWRLVICGPVNEAEFGAAVAARAAQLGDRVWLGMLPRASLLALMREAAVVCLPSRGETVGGVVLEGMYAGAAVVVSDAVEAAREDYLQDGKNGYLFPAEDVSALRETLRRAMAAPAAVRAAGRQTIATRFTWARSVDRLMEIYTSPRA